MMRQLIFILVVLSVFAACKDNIIVEQGPVPTNPYDSLDYNDSIVPQVPVDSNAFLGIHKYILSVKCAQPACHDGAFEPDYRTVQSAYNTLVFAPVVNNNSTNSFEYRVSPGDTAASWLHERITTGDPVLGKMPLYDSLPQRQIKMITDWILGGAKDIFGNTPNLPNPQPTFFGIYAELTSNGMRVDTIRGNSPVNPFMVPANSTVDIWFGVYDDITLPPFFGDKQVKFSTDPLGFSSVPAYSLITETTPQNYPAFNGVSVPFWYLHYVVNTSQFNTGDIVYMRVYVKDSSHPASTEIPSTTSPFYLQTYFAFVVQ
jgi:hypothetical protein